MKYFIVHTLIRWWDLSVPLGPELGWHCWMRLDVMALFSTGWCCLAYWSEFVWHVCAHIDMHVHVCICTRKVKMASPMFPLSGTGTLHSNLPVIKHPFFASSFYPFPASTLSVSKPSVCPAPPSWIISHTGLCFQTLCFWELCGLDPLWLSGGSSHQTMAGCQLAPGKVRTFTHWHNAFENIFSLCPISYAFVSSSL